MTLSRDLENTDILLFFSVIAYNCFLWSLFFLAFFFFSLSLIFDLLGYSSQVQDIFLGTYSGIYISGRTAEGVGFCLLTSYSRLKICLNASHCWLANKQFFDLSVVTAFQESQTSSIVKTWPSLPLISDFTMVFYYAFENVFYMGHWRLAF